MGRGPAGPRDHGARRAGHAGRGRAAGRGARRRSPTAAPSSGSGPRGHPAGASPWSCQRRAAAAPARPGRLELPAVRAARRRCRVAAVLRRRAAAGRHPARLEDRPGPGRPLGRPRAGRRARPGAAVKVLVTGASGMLGGAVAERWPPAATTSRCCSAARRRCGLPEVLADVADAAPSGAAVAGQDAVVHLAAKVDVGAVAGVRRGPTSPAPATVVAACRRAGWPGSCTCPRPRSRTPAAAGRRARGPGRSRPAPAGHYARSKALAERFALAADAATTSRVRRRPPAPGVGARATRSSSAASSPAPGRGRLPVVGLGRRADRHDVRRQRRRRPVAALDRVRGGARPGTGGVQRRAAPGRRAPRRHLRGCGRPRRRAARAGCGWPWRVRWSRPSGPRRDSAEPARASRR